MPPINNHIAKFRFKKSKNKETKPNKAMTLGIQPFCQMANISIAKEMNPMTPKKNIEIFIQEADK